MTSAKFTEMFESQLGVSSTTGYDWSKSTSETWNEETSVEVKTTVAPGTIVQLRQVVGQCGNNTVKPDFYQTVKLNDNGTIISQAEGPLSNVTTAKTA